MNILIILQRFNKDPYIYSPDDRKVTNYLMPLGLPYISAVLKEQGHQVDVLNLNHVAGYERDIIIRQLMANDYRMVLLGGLSIYYPNIRDYIRYIHKGSKSVKIVVGGGLVTSQPEIMLDKLGADILVVGEGEQTVTELAKCLEIGGNLPTIRGLMYRDKEGVRITPQRDQIQDLDSLPFPDYEAFGFQEYLDNLQPDYYVAYDIVDKPMPYPLLASRSCPFNCTFCFHPLGKKYRQRSIDNIMKELEYAVPKYRINIVFFYDELFASDKVRLLEFCERFKQFAATIPWTVRWTCNVRVDYVDDEVVSAMQQAGCYHISSGFESYSQAVLDSMRKHTTPKQIENALTVIARHNIGVQGSFIFGDTAETLDTAAETIRFYTTRQDIIRGGLQLGFIIPFQGSPIYKRCVREGVIKDEIEFLEDRAQDGYNYNEPLNLCGMNEQDFDRLKEMVMTAHLTARPHSTGYAIHGMLFTICPYCGEINHYEMEAPKIFNTRNTGCRACHGRFEVTTRLYPVKEFLVKALGFNRIYGLRKRLVY